MRRQQVKERARVTLQAVCVARSWRFGKSWRYLYRVDMGKLRHPANVYATCSPGARVNQLQHFPGSKVSLGAGQPVKPYGFRIVAGAAITAVIGARCALDVLCRTAGIRVAPL